ncbi:hypothetical protein DY000_02002011 [Brassica cretica]|uniref:Uncharacterized protein n=1 Tax=Brassica cretica TaxID=69181 RepID=A0ABQ7CJ41_BRACR|nr:hypothetical protein DY000_02002011 [Brassica cretica]
MTKPLSGISGFDQAELFVSLCTHQDLKEAAGAEMVLRAGLLSVARSNLKGLSFATLWAVHCNLVLRVVVV